MTSTTDAPAASDATSGVLTHRQILTILGGLMMGMFLAALDQTIVASAIRTIGDDLHGLSVQAWVTTAYLITSTIATPLYGKLSDIYGRKPFFLLAITLFIIGSAASAFSTSMYMLAAFRAFQGLGAGGLFSLALAIIGDIVSPRQRAKYQGYFLAVFGTSSVLGPVVGGSFAGASSILFVSGWRWVFLVNVPIGIAALYVVWRTLNIPHTRRDHRIDWQGAVAIAVGLVPLLIIAEQGRIWGWGSDRAFACYLIGVIGLAFFVYVESRAGDDALIPLRFFKVRTFSLTSVVGIVVGMGMFGGISVLPLYLQIVRGASPTQSGLLLLPLTAGMMTASIVSGQLISRTGYYRPFPIIGTGLMVVGLALMHGIGAHTAFWVTALYMVVFGFGLGNVMQPITLAVQNAMSARDIGVATSSATFFRQMGGTLGVAVFLSVLFSTVGDNIKSAFGKAAQTASFQTAIQDPNVLHDPRNAQLLKLLNSHGTVSSSALNDTSFLKHADRRLAEPFFVGFSQSMDTVFVIGAVVIAIGFVLMWFLPAIPLRTTSGLQSRTDDARAAASAAQPAPASAPSASSGESAVGRPAPGAALDS
ncbi:MAG: MFS transporter [Pseudonocardiales bacterium]|nr:MAG: MFS transporter [Pseudonocardiales bacterium]